jgi:hypothetical protein
MRFQLVAARTALAALILALLAAAIAIAGVRLGRLDFATGQLVKIPAPVLGFLALAASAAWLRSAIAHNDGTAKRIGLAALLGSLLFLYPVGDYLWQGTMGLPLYDVTSAPEDAPQFAALAKLRRPGDNSTAFDGTRKIRFEGEDATIAYVLHTWKNGLITHPHTKLLPVSKNPQATVFWRCFEIVKSLGWHIVDYSEKEGRIEAVAASFWFGQTADVVVRVKPSGYMGARYDVRAQSRRGRNDHGFTLDLVRAFRQKADR